MLFRSTKNSLQQYATDFGDRRVFAGLHYPSDTLITWLICFMLVEYVVKPNEINDAKVFLKECIRKSVVWSKTYEMRHQIKCNAFKKLITEIDVIISSS